MSTPIATVCAHARELSAHYPRLHSILNWPGLEKRMQDFSQEASSEEIKMVYVKDGNAVVKDGNEESEVGPGNLVMVSDGSTQWSVLGDKGVTLISLVTSPDEVADDGDAAAAEDDDPTTWKDLSFALGAGLLFGGTIVVAGNLLRTSGLLQPP